MYCSVDRTDGSERKHHASRDWFMTAITRGCHELVDIHRRPHHWSLVGLTWKKVHDRSEART